jgi:hypothetical protein
MSKLIQYWLSGFIVIAIIAVIISKQSTTASVLQSLGVSLSNILGAIVKPISSGTAASASSASASTAATASAANSAASVVTGAAVAAGTAAAALNAASAVTSDVTATDAGSTNNSLTA